MKLLKQIAEHLFYIWFASIVAISFLLIYPILFITLQKRSWYVYAQIIRRVWVHVSLFLGGLRVKQIIEQPLSNGPYVITPNHTSKLDMMTLHSKLGIDLIFMAREDFKNIPLFGYFFKSIDIPVNVSNKTKAAFAYRRALSELNNGTSIAIYPEATISRNTPILSPFKQGAFRLAIEAQVDILPVTAIGHWNALSDFKKFRLLPSSVIQYVHTPISTKGLTLEDTEALKQKVFGIIASKLDEYGYKQ
jgi:1-acyl-sn-glycerol-3-phosphate acyltransferase